jgi:hypothetical protein
MKSRIPMNHAGLLVALALILSGSATRVAAQSATLAGDDAVAGAEVRTSETATAPAQEQPPAEKEKKSTPRDRSTDPAAHIPELRDETFRLMDAYLISNLQESLGLTDEQFGKALPLVKKLQSDRRDYAKRRMQALRLLRKSLLSGSATEAGVVDLLKDLKNASAEERAGTERNLEVLDAVLTPIQQAKYRVFEAEVDLRLRHLLARSQDKARTPRR